MDLSELNITVVITSYNDERIISLISSLLPLSINNIIVADGGSKEGLLNKIRKFERGNVKLYEVPGSVVESRESVREKLTGDVIVFIDTDELPSDDWLRSITTPIIRKEADFVFGPTAPLHPPNSRVERFVNEYDHEFYNTIVRFRQEMGPMGNSAWRSEILKRVKFNTSLKMGGEDYDFNLKAIEEGYKGTFSENAVLYHDQSNLSSLSSFIKKKFRYMVGATIAYKMNGKLFNGIGKSGKSGFLTNDPFELLLILMKPFAFITALIIFPRKS